MEAIDYHNKLSKSMTRLNRIMNMAAMFLLGIATMAVINITAASSMSGATQTLREKGIVEHDNGQYYFIFSQEQQLEELDYLSLARLSKYDGKGVILIRE